jgi:hypothetical protein
MEGDPLPGFGLVGYAQHEFALNKRQEDGTTARDHLEHEARNRAMLGKPPPVQLESVELPYCVIYLWQWFLEVAGGRNYTDMGSPLPISYVELKAWTELTKTEPSVWEISAIKAIDHVYLNEANKK